MEILEDTKNKTEDVKNEFSWSSALQNFFKNVILITLVGGLPFYYLLKWESGKEESQNRSHNTSDAQAIKSKATSIPRSSLEHFEWYRESHKVVETNEAQLKAIEEQVSKLSLEIKELQKQKSEKNEN